MDILPDPMIEPVFPSIRREDIDEDDEKEDEFEIGEEEEGDYDKHALDETRFGFHQD
jgi:hypothetical protein